MTITQTLCPWCKPNTRQAARPGDDGYPAHLARAESELVALKRELADRRADQQRLMRLSALHELLGQIAVYFSQRDQPCIGMGDMLKLVGEFLNADLGYVLPVKRGGDWIRHPIWWHPPDTNGDETQTRRHFQKTLLQHLYQEQVLAQMADGGHPPVHTLDLTHKGLGTVMVFPVSIFGERHGVLGFRRDPDQGAWCHADLSLIRQLGEQFARALERLARDQERQIAARRLMETAVLAENANRSKSDFLARMSHEIRSPMSAIVGYTQILTEGRLEEQEVEQIGGHIRRNAQHLLSLINDILDLSKIEAGHIQLRPARLNIRNLVDDVIGLMSAQADDKLLKLTAFIDDNVPAVMLADELRLRQILINLIGNAVKYTDHGGVSVTVQRDPISAEWLSIAVADTGIGIQKNDLPGIFSPFSQAEGRENREGTGLGLSIVRQLLTLMEGDIAVQSQVGRGSLFSIRLPLLPSAMTAPDQDADTDADTESGDAALALAGKNILLVDDGEDNRRILTYFLKEAGAQVACIGDGRAALALFSAGRTDPPSFDLVLMDMLMPHLDGYQATRRLRAMGVTTPIIALTAQAMVDDRAKCLDAGCDDYLAKPVAPERLVETLGYYLDRERTKPRTSPSLPEEPPATVINPSPLWHHPKLKFIIADYVNAMDQSVTRLEAAIEEKDRRRLLDLAHRYHGNGASFGYPSVSEHAKILEEQLKTHAAMDQCFASARALVKDLRYIHTHHRCLHQTGERKQSG